MNTTTRNIIIGVVIVIIIAVLGYLAWQERQSATVPAQTSSTASTTEATSSGLAVNVSPTQTITTGGYTIKPVTTTATVTPPNYKTPLSYPATIDPSTEAQDQSQFQAVQVALASQPTNYSGWLELGILRESTGDYTGAAADWNYVTEIYPTDPTAFADLGDLYANYVHQNARAIADYKQAIQLDPTREEAFYDDLAQVYLSEGDSTDAKAVLEQGIKVQVVGYQNLQNELNSMQ